MIKGIYVESDFTSIDRGPGIPVDQKLAEIASSPVKLTPVFKDFRVRLPYTEGLMCSPRVDKTSGKQILHIERANIGDEALYGKGIGTRLLKSALRYALEVQPRLSEFTAQHARLGFVNTAVKVAGESEVSVVIDEVHYGLPSGPAIGDMFKDVPVSPDWAYTVDFLRASVNPDQVKTWEMPV
jgi:hypothetical protein